ELDLRIIGSDFRDEVERGKLLKRSVSERVAHLAGPGHADVSAYRGDDRELMRLAFLFEVYHQVFERLDECIEAQVKAGDTPVPVPFARDALALLAARG